MKADEVLATLRQNAENLRDRGVRHAALFGSLARGEADAGSDIDILVELDPQASFDIFRYSDLRLYIGTLFSHPVDVVSREALKPHIRPRVDAEAQYAF